VIVVGHHNHLGVLAVPHPGTRTPRNPMAGWKHRTWRSRLFGRFMAGSPENPTPAFLDVIAVLLDPPARTRGVSAWDIRRAVRRPTIVVERILDRLTEAGWISSQLRELCPGAETAYRLTAEGAERARDLLHEHRPRWL
jgi:hypothetical protein